MIITYRKIANKIIRYLNAFHQINPRSYYNMDTQIERELSARIEQKLSSIKNMIEFYIFSLNEDAFNSENERIRCYFSFNYEQIYISLEIQGKELVGISKRLCNNWEIKHASDLPYIFQYNVRPEDVDRIVYTKENTFLHSTEINEILSNFNDVYFTHERNRQIATQLGVDYIDIDN